MFVLLLKSFLGLLVSLQNPLQEAPRNDELITITFEMHSPDLAEDANVFIAGNLPELGNWNPSKIRMRPIGNHQWSYEIKCNPNLPIEYKYTLVV